MKKSKISIIIIGFTLSTIILSCSNVAKEKKSKLPILGEDKISFFTNDTIHYKVHGASLIDDKGQNNEDILNKNNKIKIINFFFSKCPSICPIMNQNLNELSNTFKTGNVVLQSISIDTKNDTAKKLANYRSLNNYNNSNWIFYTGEKEEIFKIAKNCKLKAFEDDSQENALVHDPTIILLDTKNQIRGYYNSLNKKDISKLEKDIFILIEETS